MFTLVDKDRAALHPSRLEQPKGEDYVDENGIRTTVEYTVNDEGKKVKVRS